jgi:hypothetical protein
MWLSIRADVKAWTLENWERWGEEKVAWFDDNFRSSVDDDMIPPESLRRLNGVAVGGSRRRSSLGDIMGIQNSNASGRTSARVGPSMDNA